MADLGDHSAHQNSSSSHYFGRNMTFPRQQQQAGHQSGNMRHGAVGCMGGGGVNGQRQDLPALIPEEDAPYRLPCGEPESSSCSDGHLSDIMPDVAMATSSLGQMQIDEIPESLQLDLGDGPGHLPAGVAGVDLRNIQVHIFLY